MDRIVLTLKKKSFTFLPEVSTKVGTCNTGMVSASEAGRQEGRRVGGRAWTSLVVGQSCWFWCHVAVRHLSAPSMFESHFTDLFSCIEIRPPPARQ